MNDKFVLLDGYIEINNELLFIKKKNREIKERGGFIGIIIMILCVDLFYNLNRFDFLSSISDYISLIIQSIGAIVLIYLVYYLIFKKKWSKELFINEINKITLDKDEFETEVIIQFNNKRIVDFEFRNLENQLEPFLETLMKRNSRIIIKNR